MFFLVLNCRQLVPCNPLLFCLIQKLLDLVRFIYLRSSHMARLRKQCLMWLLRDGNSEDAVEKACRLP